MTLLSWAFVWLFLPHLQRLQHLTRYQRNARRASSPEQVNGPVDRDITIDLSKREIPRMSSSQRVSVAQPTPNSLAIEPRLWPDNIPIRARTTASCRRSSR